MFNYDISMLVVLIVLICVAHVHAVGKICADVDMVSMCGGDNIAVEVSSIGG